MCALEKEAATGSFDHDSNLPTYYHMQREPIQMDWLSLHGAAGQIRTADLILTKDALYLLSYSSIGDPERARTVDLQRDRLAY